ncbi:MAG: phosphate ABC transporter permease PstA [Bacteroidota bacterium]
MKELLRTGDIFVWMTGAFLGISIIMICGMVLLIGVNGLGHFHPADIRYFEYRDENGEHAMALGQVYAREEIPNEIMALQGYSNIDGRKPIRYLVRIGNRDLFGDDFRWIAEPDVLKDTVLSNAVCLERTEYGAAYGILARLQTSDARVYDNEIDAWDAFQRSHPTVRSLVREIYAIEKKEIGEVNYTIEQLRRELGKYKYKSESGTMDQASYEAHEARVFEEISVVERQFGEIQHRVDSLKGLLHGYDLTLRAFGTSGEETMELPLASVVRGYKPNIMSVSAKAWFYLEKIWEFISDDPREANAEGGVFPAIFGTVLMVLLMSLAAVPFGVLAALYLREYAKQGFFVRTVRIAVNNLAGVPSIVFGMFGLGFFVYFVGGGIDHLFYPERLPNPTYGTGGILWASLTLALLTVPVVIVATEEALASIPRGIREGSFALGATQWDTIRRVIIPTATPGIMTGAILAMARGAGEVAPLMITGVVKLATEMPFDGNFPFFHLDRKFMHLGFHIYDVGFQTSNVEANIGMVYTTALLLLVIILLLNLTAIIFRARLRRKYRLAGF